MRKKDIEAIYEKVRERHQLYLQGYGVSLPKLYNVRKNFSVDALTLVFLARNYPATKWVTKTKLTNFVRQYYPDINDVQSARHLGMQRGFYIVSSRRGNYLPQDKPPPPASAYLLVTLEKPHLLFIPGGVKRQIVILIDSKSFTIIAVPLVDRRKTSPITATRKCILNFSELIEIRSCP